MLNRVSSSQFHALHDLPDWRVVLRRIEATFRAASFEDAAAFVVGIAAAADQADHHPDVDLRYPAVVHVTLTTHTTNSLTDADVALAATISTLASNAGLTSAPVGSVGLEVAIDALDIDAVRPFWKAILGYEDEAPAKSGGQVIGIVDPLRIGPAFWFQQMDVARPQRNRIHLDITVPHDVAEQRIADAIGAGGHLVNDASSSAFWILADTEGNEACVCTWQDRE